MTGGEIAGRRAASTALYLGQKNDPGIQRLVKPDPAFGDDLSSELGFAGRRLGFITGGGGHFMGNAISLLETSSLQPIALVRQSPPA